MSGGGSPDLKARVLAAVGEALDRELAASAAAPPPASDGGEAAAPRPDPRPDPRLVLADVLGDDILGARAGDKAFPLRVMLAKLGEACAPGSDDEIAFALACALNFYFRVSMDEEVKMRLGVEASRQYYRFAQAALEAREREKVSPLLAALLSTQLSRVKLESVDHAAAFDSSVHERDAGSDGGSARIAEPRSFVARVVATGMVRAKALVAT